MSGAGGYMYRGGGGGVSRSIEHAPHELQTRGGGHDLAMEFVHFCRIARDNVTTHRINLRLENRKRN